MNIMLLNLTNGSCHLPLETDRDGLTFIYSLALSLGLPSNLLSIWGLYQLGRSGGGGCQLVYILNLLLSDLLQLLTLPLWILYLQRAHHWLYGSTACQLVAYVFYVNVYASVVFLCLIAMDRFLAIVYPLSSRRVRSMKVAALSGILVWSLTFLFCLSGLYPSVFEPSRGLCLEQYPVSPKYARFKIVSVVINSLKTEKDYFLITVIFFVIFGPYHLVGCYRFVTLLLTDDPCSLERSVYLAYRLCYGITSLNTLLDPLFYIFLCHDARHKLRRSLSCLGRDKTGSKSGIVMATVSPRSQIDQGDTV
uniref:G-protein coupled receptors family 1 profile domain-containing protein n=1 Tax=Denticeps clupeoides TaxID=299321 RepID=A0AAY4BM61_9TELE